MRHTLSECVRRHNPQHLLLRNRHTHTHTPLQTQFVIGYLNTAAPSLGQYPIASVEDAFPAIREGKCGAALLGRSGVELLIAGAWDDFAVAAGWRWCGQA